MIIRRVAVVGIVLAGMLALGGCDGSPAPAASTPPFASEEEAFAAAEETYRAYVDALNEVDLADPETFEPVFALTTGELHSSDVEGLTRYHADGVTVSGASRVDLIAPLGVDDEFSRIRVAVCLDVSTVNLLDRKGLSLVDPTRVDIQTLSVTVERAADNGTRLLVSAINPREGEPSC